MCICSEFPVTRVYECSIVFVYQSIHLGVDLEGVSGPPNEIGRVPKMNKKMTSQYMFMIWKK